MKLICMSDSHSKHLQIPKNYLNNNDGSIDAIIHCGDISNIGKKQEVIDFLNWYSELPFKHKIFIPGNHDFFFDYNWKPYTVYGQIRFGGLFAGVYTKEIVEEVLSLFPQIIYLNDSSIVIDGVKIHGSPITPWFQDWAFNREPNDIIKHWDMIPSDTQILVVHGPLKKYLDITIHGDYTGCPYLIERIKDLKKLSLICHGHIHEAYGHFKFGNGQLIVNASVLDHNYKMKNKPYLLEYNKETNKTSIINF